MKNIGEMAQTVRVRHNGQVTEISALTLDESQCGGAEIFSQIAAQLGLPRERMRVIHRGRLLTPESISRVLREDPAAIVQVLGSQAVTLQRPLWARVRDAWDALLLLLLCCFPRDAREQGMLWCRRAREVLATFFIAAMEFLRTFMPGYVPAPPQQRGQGGAGGEDREARPRTQWPRFGRHCRDDINVEYLDRNAL